MKFQYAENGYHFVLTEHGYVVTGTRNKLAQMERRIGLPVKGYETFVPASWIEKGYVEKVKIGG